jgi:hypothetical protein
MDIESKINKRLNELERSLECEHASGANPDSYNVGWLEGGIHALRAVRPEQGHLVQRGLDWVCPVCNTWIDDTELACGCGRTRPKRA